MKIFFLNVWKFADKRISKHVWKEDNSVNCLINQTIMIVIVEQPLAFSRSAKYSHMICPTSGHNVVGRLRLFEGQL